MCGDIAGHSENIYFVFPRIFSSFSHFQRNKIAKFCRMRKQFLRMFEEIDLFVMNKFIDSFCTGISGTE